MKHKLFNQPSILIFLCISLFSIENANAKPLSGSHLNKSELYHTSLTYSGNQMQTTIITDQEYTMYRMSFQGGISRQIGLISPFVSSTFENYVSEMRTGYNIGGNFTYYPIKALGLGLYFNSFLTSNEMEEDYYFTNELGNTVYGKVYDNVSVSFIGPGVSCRILANDGITAFLPSFAIGYLKYNNSKSLIKCYEISGHTIGITLGLGFDLKLKDNLGLGFNTSLLLGSIGEFSIEDGLNTSMVLMDRDNFETLNRVDFSITLSFSN